MNGGYCTVEDVCAWLLLFTISLAVMYQSRIQSLDVSSIHFSQSCEKVQLRRRCSSLSARVSRLSKNSGGKFVSVTRIVASSFEKRGVLDSKSSSPPLFDGTTRLYFSSRCPYAQRVWAAVKYKGLATKRSFSPSSNRDCSRLRRNLWLRTLGTSNKLSLRDDTPAEPALAEEEADYIEDEEDFTEEDAITTSLGTPTEEFRNRAWDHKYLLAVAGVPGIFSGLESFGSVIQSIAVLAAVISVHEAGHFLAARLQGIHVTKFAIGFGPTLAKYQGKEVEYSLRAIPLGGYVAFPDDDPQSGFQADDPDLLKNRGIPSRALVISAGVIANIIFAYSVLFGQVLTVGLVEQEYLPGVVIPEIIARSAASRGGLEAGDVVLSVGGRTLDVNVGAVFDLVDTIKDNPGRTLDFEVRRQGFPDLVKLKITPDLAYDGAGKIGVQLSTNASLHRVKATNLGVAVTKASKEFVRLTATVTEGLKQVFFNFAQTADKLSGPVAIVAVGAEVARSDIAGLFQFAAIVNINLAVVNMLPLPALDGGYLFLIALEALRGKKLPEGVEKGIMSSGILLLLAVGVVLMVRDTLNLGIVQQLL